MRHIPIYLYVYDNYKIEIPSFYRKRGRRHTLLSGNLPTQRSPDEQRLSYFTEEWDNEREDILIATNSERKYHLLNIRLSAHKELSRYKEIAEKMNAEGINYTIDDMCNAFMKHSTEKPSSLFYENK